MNGLTIEELAERTRMYPEYVRDLLDDERRRGYVVEVDGRFSLTPEVERRFGWALRGVMPPGQESS